MDRNFALEFVRVTEMAAIASARLMGRGDEKAADQAAVDAMRTTDRENKISLKTRIHFGTFINRTFHKTTREISFIDNGPGIPEEIIDSIFFPLVSSKEIKSGLGLSIAQGIVSQHGGAIECESSSSGTKFSIYLPLKIEDEDAKEASKKENYESA